MSGAVSAAPIGATISRRQMSGRSARAGRELALAILPLSITDTGGGIPARKRTERPSPRTHEIPQTSGAADAIRLVRESAESWSCVCVCVRAADLVDGDDNDDDNENDDDAARTFGRETNENRGQIRTGVPWCRGESACLVPEDEDRAGRKEGVEEESRHRRGPRGKRKDGGPDRSPREFERSRNCQPSWSRESIAASHSLARSLPLPPSLFLPRAHARARVD